MSCTERPRRRKITALLPALLVALATVVPVASAQDLTVTVAAPDGTPLATDVYFPFFGSTWPVVLARTPYGKDGVRETCEAFTALGYACVAQDTRGRFDSGGEDTVFRDDGPDGHATLDWLADQSWCDGRVGTFGGSALGITQYQMAPGAPPILQAQVVAVATADQYHHAMLQGGALRDALVRNWLDGQGSLSFLDLVLDHRLWDAWWADVTPVLDAESVDVPTLHMGGWYDIFLQGTLDAFTAWQERGGPLARGNQHLYIGPWTHGCGLGRTTAGELTYPINALCDLTVPMVDFFDHWLKGRHNDVEGWPAVHIYLMGAAGEAGARGNVWLDLLRSCRAASCT